MADAINRDVELNSLRTLARTPVVIDLRPIWIEVGPRIVARYLLQESCRVIVAAAGQEQGS